jgi:methionyl-tRNA formyltransferase
MTPYRVVFMGTPQFAVPTLQGLIASHHTVVAAYSQPPRPAGRGQKLTPSAVHQLAEQHKIPVYTPTSLKSEEAQEQFRAHQADIAVVAAYGLLLPQVVLDAPRLGCLNIHPSALPRWRGAAPIQRTLMAGDVMSECCIMKMDAGLDTGAVLLREGFVIPPDMVATELYNSMASLGATLLIRTLEQFEERVAQPQSSNGVTYATKITKEEYAIRWNQHAEQIVNHIRGLSVSPAASCRHGEETLKIIRAKRIQLPHMVPAGTLLSDDGIVACGNGSALQLLEVQRAGKPRMDIAEFLRGYALPRGTVMT